LTSKQLEKHLKDEASRAKTTGSRTNAMPIGADDESSIHEDDYDMEVDHSDEGGFVVDSPKGFIIQALRLEAAQ
jgi:hypothetical protein